MLSEQESRYIQETAHTREKHETLTYKREARDNSKYITLRHGEHAILEFMMDSHPQSGLIKTFEFEKSPIERIADVIVWAEEIVKKNKEYYNKVYEWGKK